MIALSELDRDLHAQLARLRSAGPVVWVEALGGWLVCSYAEAAIALRDPSTFTVDDPRFSTAQVVGPSMLSLDGPAHARHRTPFAAAFRAGDVRERFTALTAAEVDRLLTTLEPAGGAEIRRQFAGPLAVAVIAAALGLPAAGSSRVLGWYDAIVGGVNALSAGEPVGVAAPPAFAELRAHVESVVARGEPSLLVDAVTGGLPVPDTVANAAVLMFGGIETTEGMIANVVLHLLSAPDQLERVRQDAALLPNAVEESLRIEPAAAVVDRYATRDVELGGAAIGRGDLVIVSLAAANRDPAVFADPDRFDVRRTNAGRHLAFALGPHFCLGIHLARLEAITALAAMLERYPKLQLDPARTTSPAGLVFRKAAAVMVVWDGHPSSNSRSQV